MKFKRRLAADDEAVPMSSMADIAFLLVIFFMVTSVFSVERGLLIELPETQVREAISLKELVITISADGEVEVDGRTVAVEEIAGQVAEARRIHPNRSVVVMSDRHVPYGRIADVMDELLQAGIRDVALPTVPEGGGDG